MDQSLSLNAKAFALCQQISDRLTELQVERHFLSCGTTAFDFTMGNQEAGIMLARVCLADLAEVRVVDDTPWPKLHVQTTHPVAACMASQYAGWEIKGEDYFALGSGPMRAAAAREELFQSLGYRERAKHCVGVLETNVLPTDAVCADIAANCGIDPTGLTLLYAPTNSLPGKIQVVARSVEASLHKLHELGFELRRVERGMGSAPLPPVAKKALAAIGRTNDAILYGAEVTLGIRGDDPSLAELGPHIPSSASPEYGKPFAEILASYDNDFYQVDPLLFSAASVTLENLDTGSSFAFGKVNSDLLSQSFDN